MGESGVYNSTTISYENPGGGLSMSEGGSQRRPWNLSEMVSPPANRSRWFHWMLLMGGSITLGLGLIVVVIGIYNQHYYNPESHNVKMNDDESPPSHWIVTLMGFGLTILGLILLVIYCRMVNTNRLLCNPLSRTRSALREVVTKPRYPKPTNRGSNLLGHDANNTNPMGTQYNPIPDIAYRQTNGDVTSEEKAKLMANEMKEGPVSKCPANPPIQADGSRNGPYDNRNDNGPDPSRRSPTPPQRPMRHKFSSLRRDIDPYPASSQQSHYKPRHFAGHGYGQGKLPPALSGSGLYRAPLASAEDVTPSLRSSFASVMMYQNELSDWENSDESFDSTVFLNLPPAKDDLDRAEADKGFKTSSAYDIKFENFRVSPARHNIRKNSSSLSIQSAFS